MASALPKRLLASSCNSTFASRRPVPEVVSSRLWFAAAPELADFVSFLVGPLDLDGPVVRETTEDAAGRRAESLLLFLLCAQETRYRSGRQLITAWPGDILCFDLARAADIVFEPACVTALAIQRSLLRLSPMVLDGCHNARIGSDAALGQFFAGHLNLLSQTAQSLSVREGEALSESVGTLAATLLRAAQPFRTADILELPIAAILAFIDANLARTDLSPALIGRHFGLSRSALYRLFEPIGGIAACIRERRLECAKRQMSTAGAGRGSVARLALSVGFPSDAAFARAFRNRYGVVPSKALSTGERADDFVTAGRWRRNWLECSGAT